MCGISRDELDHECAKIDAQKAYTMILGMPEGTRCRILGMIGRINSMLVKRAEIEKEVKEFFLEDSSENI